jgi:hypothetical protein
VLILLVATTFERLYDRGGLAVATVTSTMHLTVALDRETLLARRRIPCVPRPGCASS